MAGSNQPMIRFRGVRKRFGSVCALDSLDLQIQKGKTTVIIGPSGCGKSTLLRLIIGLLEPDDGAVEFEGEPVRQANALELRRRMGYVIQDGGLFPHLTARANVTLMAKHIGQAANEIHARLDELCELTRFPRESLVRHPVELSGGQRQRVSLMRGLMLTAGCFAAGRAIGRA